MNSPRHAPAGLLAERGSCRLMIDGGAAGRPSGELDDWLVTDEQGELVSGLRRLGGPRGGSRGT